MYMADQSGTEEARSESRAGEDGRVMPAARPAINMADREPQPPFRFLIPIMLVLLIPLMHATALGDVLLRNNWLMLGLGGAIFSLFMFVSGIRLQAGERSEALGMASWSLLIAYLLHQFEEFGVDLYGNLNALPAYVNGQLAEQLSHTPIMLTEFSVYRINTLGIWVPFLLAIWAGHRFPWMGLAVAGLMLTNAAVHIGLAFMMREYNPGLATALLLFLPLSLRYFIVSNNKTDAGWGAALIGIAFGLATHAALPALTVRLSEPAWTAEMVLLLAALILSPVVGNLLYRLMARKA
ncbi:MAG: hypothetical protein CML99_09165 [Rhodobiaceae bacterium]|nr:hypothetical protein [Rhodobiaceae bacterium]